MFSCLCSYEHQFPFTLTCIIEVTDMYYYSCDCIIYIYIYRIIFILFKLLSLMYTYLFMYMTKFMIILSIYVLYSLYSNFTFAACTPLIFDNLGHFSPQTLYFAILEPLFYEYLRVHIEYSSFIPRNLFLILCITLLVTCIYCTMYYMCIY